MLFQVLKDVLSLLREAQGSRAVTSRRLNVPGALGFMTPVGKATSGLIDMSAPH